MAKAKKRRTTRVKSRKKSKAATRRRPRATTRPKAAVRKTVRKPPAKKKKAKTAAHPASAPDRVSAPASLPNIEVQATGGQRFRLSDLRGRTVILYFYPKDDTPGCTQEGCDIRDNFPDFKIRDVVVYGVSRDPVASHEKFKGKYGFPFELISDPDERMCRAFGVMQPKSLYGRPYIGVERSTFVYDRNGQLRRELRGVKVPGHVAELLMELDKL